MSSRFRKVDSMNDKPNKEATSTSVGPRHIAPGHKWDDFDDVPDHQRKSNRMKRVLIIVLLLALCAVAAVGYFAYQIIITSQDTLTQQPNTTDVDAVREEGHESSETGVVAQKTKVPNLIGLFGKTREEAIKAIGHGATVTKTTDGEEGSDVKEMVSLELSEEPGDTKSGTPTVYLGLNEDGTVIRAGYSAATASLGYGALSLQDIVLNEHVVERVLVDCGLIVENGSVVLPENPADYQTYATDGTTLVRESVKFNGDAPSAQGSAYTWDSVLTYDYTAANVSGNLADTVRQLYIYVQQA